MLKKNIKYTDYNGVERSEDFYFNLSKAEIVEMELGTTGGFSDMIQRIIDTKDVPQIVKLFKDLVLKAYGVKSADGKRFIKIDDNGVPLSRAFSQTEAYSVLYMELATNDEAAAKFVNGIMPADMVTDEVQAKAKAFLEQKNR